MPLTPEQIAFRKAATAQLLAQPAWKIFTATGEDIIREAGEAALTCEDESKIVSLQRDARVFRKFYDEWMFRMQAVAVSDTSTADDFVEVTIN